MEDTTRIRPYPRLLGAAGLVVAIDQLSKQWALSALDDGPITVIPGVLKLNLTFNSGGAFGLLKGVPGFFLIASVIVAILIAVWARTVDDPKWLFALGMVLGGGLGNVIDRVFRDLNGQVVDFLDLGWWPVFNVADVAIVLGIVGIAILGLRSPEAARDPATPDTPPSERT